VPVGGKPSLRKFVNRMSMGTILAESVGNLIANVVRQTKEDKKSHSLLLVLLSKGNCSPLICVARLRTCRRRRSRFEGLICIFLKSSEVWHAQHSSFQSLHTIWALHREEIC
jgi:hypothetical protein